MCRAPGACRTEARGTLMLEENLAVGASEPLGQLTGQLVFVQRLGAGHGAGRPTQRRGPHRLVENT